MMETFFDFFNQILGDGGAMFAYALILGGFFGFIGERSGFCLRAAIEEWASRGKATEVVRKCGRTTQFASALIVAIVATQTLLFFELIDVSESVHRRVDFTWVAMLIGGLLFGVGMVLAGGCASRLTVLAARGNLRSWWTLIILAIAAYATLSGILSPLRLFLEDLASTGSPSPFWGESSLMPALLVCLPLVVLILLSFNKTCATRRDLFYGFLAGLTVPLGWLITSSWAADPFSEAAVVSMSFTRPLVDSLQLITISSALNWNFGMGLIAGVLVGAFISAALAGRLAIDGFREKAEPLRYAWGATLMGFGGVIGLGCSMGQGLSGMSLLSSGSLMVFSSIIAGAFITFKLRHRDY